MFKRTQQQDSRLLQRSPLSLAVGIALSLSGSLHYAQAETQAASVQEAARQSTAFSISAQPLSSALLRFAEQAGLQVFFADVKLENMQAVALQGRFTPEQGIRQLIGANPVDFQIGSNGVITLRPRSVNVDTAKIDDVMTVRAFTVANPGDWIYEQPRAISVISREQMDNRPSRHAADMLEQSAGVYSSVSQQDPSLSVNIRGIQDFGRVNMNIDGVRQNFQKTGYGQRNGQMYIDSELLSGATIEKGATNVMGSAGTLGGVATFNTVNAHDFLAPGKELGGKLHASTGDNGTHFIGSGVLALGNERGDILVGASERHLGNYWPGNDGNLGNIRIPGNSSNYEAWANNLKHQKVTSAAYTMRSRLAKIGWNLPANQRFQLSYMQTQTSSENAGTLSNLSNTELGWKASGHSEIMARSTALDYSLKPDNQRWLDFKAKIYYADTHNDTDNYALSNTSAYHESTRLRTYGAQAQNTSTLWQQGAHDLKADYGLDFYYDKITTDSTNSTASNATPEGNRAMASLFANLNYAYDEWVTLQGGLRYDRYRLRGTTSISYREIPYTVADPCKQGSIARCPPFVTTTQDWNVDDEHGKLSPTLFAGVRPGVEWLQLYTSYGLSWRPPSVSETFANGTYSAGNYYLYPNPNLKPERSRAWEVGFNIQKPELFTDGDRLVTKVSYFDTRINNYISLNGARNKPGYNGYSLSNSVFQNNLAKSRFRGMEYQLNYDAGFLYVDATYTHMIGNNDFCAPVAWMGGVTTVGGSQGNYYSTPVDTTASDASCQKTLLFSNAAYLPGDRGSVTLGTRVFDRKLDMGVTMRFAPGYQDAAAPANSAYLADWPKYEVYDLYASYRLTDSLTVRGSVENIANRTYVVSYGESLGYTPSRGRTVQAGVEYRF
ncbi:TonB-dependent receptor [Pectobacterium odoriferum]|uniref:TonB-dependent receptor n=1 Tax=Pectobacterium odoriferum TaxID=78398 RepID=UPI00052A2BFA|nr:TonB-dependent receptor [Pectobacterium odoriferum]AIU87940.1 TonB-dependent receptor [Pectobacterium odoriferum]POE18363.1 TonB-dependent receptor [Pectobacterium odoriferum]POE35374.1 TonB-dependent receptor [Pectobacterium odoriferum]